MTPADALQGDRTCSSTAQNRFLKHKRQHHGRFFSAGYAEWHHIIRYHAASDAEKSRMSKTILVDDDIDVSQPVKKMSSDTADGASIWYEVSQNSESSAMNHVPIGS